MILLASLFYLVKGNPLTSRSISSQVKDTEHAFGNNNPHAAAYGIKMLVAKHGHKSEIAPVITSLLDRLAAHVTLPPSDKPTLLENIYEDVLRKQEKHRAKNPPGFVDTLYSSLVAGRFAPPPVNDLQHAQQAVLYGINLAIAAHREEPQMVAITRTLLDHIVPSEPRRVQEACDTILSTLQPRLLGLGFDLTGSQGDLPTFLYRQYHATDPLRRTIRARYESKPS